MTQYLVDTSVLIDASKGQTWAWQGLRDLAVRGDQLAVCAISVGEFYAGAPTGKHPKMDKLIASMDYWDIPRDVAVAAGQLRYEAARRGAILHLPDAVTAAVALVQGATVLTENVKDFRALDAPVVSLRPK